LSQNQLKNPNLEGVQGCSVGLSRKMDSPIDLVGRQDRIRRRTIENSFVHKLMHTIVVPGDNDRRIVFAFLGKLDDLLDNFRVTDEGADVRLYNTRVLLKVPRAARSKNVAGAIFIAYIV
jgi:hypothetical protein